MIAYIYLKSTQQVVAKIDDDNEDRAMFELLQAMPNDDYGYRIEQRKPDAVRTYQRKTRR